jgi:hypothetical protein
VSLTPKQLTRQAIHMELSGMYWLEDDSVEDIVDVWCVVACRGLHERFVDVPHSLGADPDTCSDRVAEALAPLLELRPCEPK